MTMRRSGSDFDKVLLNDIHDPPFPYPHPTERSTSFIVGAEAQLTWFGSSFRACCSGSFYSPIVGESNSGKSHFMRHLEWRFKENKYKGFYLLYDLINELTASDEGRARSPVSRIRNALIDANRNGLAKMSKNRTGSKDSNHLIATAIQELERKYPNSPAGFCIALDNVDEYVRETGEGGSSNRFGNLLGIMRGLVSGSSETHMLVLFAMTADAYDAFRKVASTADPTHLRRLKLTNTHFLQKLSEEQSYELVHSYLRNWAESKGLTVPHSDECMTKVGNDLLCLYPFSPDSVRAFYQAGGGIPGVVVACCKVCIEKMRDEGAVSIIKDAKAAQYIDDIIEELRPTLTSDVLERFRDGFKGEVASSKLHQYIDTTLIPKLAKASTDNLSQKLREAFRTYAKLIGIAVNIDVSIKNHFHNRPPYIKTELWTFEDTVFSVHFVMGSPARGSGSIDVGDVKHITSPILEGPATHGLFICFFTNATYESGSPGATGPLELLIHENCKEVVDRIRIDPPVQDFGPGHPNFAYRMIALDEGDVPISEDEKRIIATSLDEKHIHLREVMRQLSKSKRARFGSEDLIRGAREESYGGHVGR